LIIWVHGKWLGYPNEAQTKLYYHFRTSAFPSWKGEEHRNFVLFYFHFAIEQFQRDGPAFDPEVQIWEQFAYLVRAVVLPDIEYEGLNRQHLDATVKSFMKNVEANYGVGVMSYNLHAFSHNLHFRERGNLAARSAFGPEGMYSLIRRGFVEGRKRLKIPF
jgi:hypothetical protein